MKNNTQKHQYCSAWFRGSCNGGFRDAADLRHSAGRTTSAKCWHPHILDADGVTIAVRSCRCAALLLQCSTFLQHGNVTTWQFYTSGSQRQHSVAMGSPSRSVNVCALCWLWLPNSVSVRRLAASRQHWASARRPCTAGWQHARWRGQGAPASDAPPPQSRHPPPRRRPADRCQQLPNALAVHICRLLQTCSQRTGTHTDGSHTMCRERSTAKIVQASNCVRQSRSMHAHLRGAEGGGQRGRLSAQAGKADGGARRLVRRPCRRPRLLQRRLQPRQPATGDISHV